MKSRKFQLIFILLVGFFLTNTVKGQNCKYDKNGFKEVPWGHIQSEVTLGKFRQIKGKTIVGNQNLYGVKIALYKLNNDGKIYIGSQISDMNGNFCFKNLKDGKYQLRMGMDGLNSRYFILELKKNDKNLPNKIEAILEVGT